MKEAKIDDMELGNLLFGNSRGQYTVKPRMQYQNAFCRFLERNGWDDYAIRNDGSEFENDTFVVRAYYWGDDEDIAALPNFVYKPLGLEISWYKYPMRDAYSNMDIDISTFKTILDECEKSMLG